MATLSGPMRPSQSGDRTSVVVLLHGYGADGADLIGLADVMAEHLMGTEFRAPNASERNAMNPMGYQWFGIPGMDGTPQEEREKSFARSIDLLNGYLDELMAETGLPASKIALVGFSQGTMMSLHVGPRREEQLACIVGFSGRLLAPERLAGEIRSKPPVLLIHGEADPVVPFESLEEARKGLDDAGIFVRTLACPGVPHSISPDGLVAALQMLKAHLE